jgi:hypothetical protein
MAPTHTTVWQLYVDESGRFSEPGRDVAVVGVLAPAMDAAAPAELARRLREAAPPPWPLHAAYLHRPGWWLVSLLNPDAGIDTKYPDVYQRAMRAALAAGGDQLSSILEAVRVGRSISVDESLIPLDEGLKASDNGLYRIIEDQLK